MIAFRHIQAALTKEVECTDKNVMQRKKVELSTIHNNKRVCFKQF